jgi:hypothetical protein
MNKIIANSMHNVYKIAYISRVIYPKSRASVLQIIKLAAAFADQIGVAHLFVRDLSQPAA